MTTVDITDVVRGEFKKTGMGNYDLIRAVKDENGDMRALAREVRESEANTVYANGTCAVFKYLPESKYGALNCARYDLPREKAEQLLEYGF